MSLSVSIPLSSSHGPHEYFNLSLFLSFVQARRKNIAMVGASRRKEVQASMRALKVVLGERERCAKEIQAKKKFDMVRAKALAEGRAPSNAPDVIAAKEAAGLEGGKH